MGRSPTAPPAQADLDADLSNDVNLLRDWREPVTAQRLTRAGVGSIAIHALAFLIFWISPEVTFYRVPPGVTPDLRKSALLIVPQDLLQGPVPSPGSTPSRQRQAAAPPRGDARRFRPPALTPGQPEPPAPMLQQPAIEAPPDSVSAPPSIAGIGAPATLPPPAPKPKASFEPVGGQTAPSSGAKQPLTPAEEALRAAVRSAGGVTPVHADTPQDLSGLPELRSDPKGVDFTQYLMQVRTKVKKNWLAVIPDAARRGLRGVVQVDFAIDRRGLTRNVKIASPSGTQSFDLAAVAGITASYPFPPLPAEYKGDEIELRMTFTYSTTQR